MLMYIGFIIKGREVVKRERKRTYHMLCVHTRARAIMMNDIGSKIRLRQCKSGFDQNSSSIYRP
jgi:hypothetical protein